MYQRICNGAIDYPPGLDPVTKSLLDGLLRVNPSTRLGCTAIGAEERKTHPWFHGIDWGKVLAHRYHLPLMPMVEDDGDSSNFADYSDTSYFQDVLGGKPCNVHFDAF
jgi:serine/threonine protein kinase